MTTELMDPHKPKYLQMADILTHEIVIGSWPIGAQFLSERDMIERFGVSSATARKCMDILCGRRLISRIQGKGTFIESNGIKVDLSPSLSLSGSMTQIGLKPMTKVLKIELSKATRQISDKLGIEEGQQYIDVVRLRLVNDGPISIEHSRISASLCPGIEHCDLTQSMTSIFREKYRLSLIEEEIRLRLSLGAGDFSEFLGVAKNDPTIFVASVRYASGKIPVVFEETWYRGEHNEFHFVITP